MAENTQSSSVEFTDTSMEPTTTVTGGANVSCRNQNNYMKLNRERLDRENMEKFRDSCFGQFIDVDTKKAQGQLVYLLYKHLDLNAIQRRRLGFIINGRHLELGPAEYFLITGLHFSGWEEPPSCSKIHNKIFGGKDRLFVKDIYKAFDDFSLKKKGKGKTVFKLALLLVLYGTLLVRHQTSKLIEVQYLHLVDDLKKINNYPWGLVSYQLLVTASYNTKLRIDETLPEKPVFDVFGFTFALQVFAYEVHRDLALHCAKAVEGASKAFPRMLRWTTNKYYHLSAILQYFGMSHALSVELMDYSDEERLLLASNEIDYDMICPVPIEKILQHCKVVKPKCLTPSKRKLSLGGSAMQKKQKVKLKGKVEVNGKGNSKFEQVRCSGSPSFDVNCSQRRAFVSDGSPSFHVGSSKRRTFEEASSGFDDEIPTAEDVSSDRALKLMKLLLDKFASLQSEVGEMRGDIKTLKNVGRCSFRDQSFNEEMPHRSMVDPSIELQSYVYRDEHDPSTRATYDLFGDLKLQDVVVKQAEKKAFLRLIVCSTNTSRMDVQLSLKVMINKERSKVLFAVADNHFADILLSFLTLPLGRILKVLEKHYGDEAPRIGSLSSLYHSLANLDSSHFVTEGAKNTLLNPTSSFEDEYQRLKVDISDSPPTEYFYCSKCSLSYGFCNVSMYYDQHLSYCQTCRVYRWMSTKVVEKSSEATSRGGVFTKHKATFVISDDLQILPYEIGILRIGRFLGVTGTDKAIVTELKFGLNEVMDLLKATLTSPTPLLDIILNKTTQMSSAIVESQPMIAKQDNPNSRNFILKGLIQKSSSKILYAQAEEDFVEFLFSFFHIPLGGAENLLGGKTCIKAFDNLYSSIADLIDDKNFKCTNTKERLMKPNLPHGCISEDHILPLTEECLPADYTDNLNLFSSDKFPKGQGSYLEGRSTYQVTDDLTVTPFCFVSILSSLHEQKIPLSDVKEVELHIGLKEALSILKASLTSTSALTNALLSQISNKQPKSG